MTSFKAYHTNTDSSLTTERTTDTESWTIKEVASFLKMSVKTIHRRCLENEIPSKKIGGQYRFSPSLIKAWLKGEHE